MDLHLHLYLDLYPKILRHIPQLRGIGPLGSRHPVLVDLPVDLKSLTLLQINMEVVGVLFKGFRAPSKGLGVDRRQV